MAIFIFYSIKKKETSIDIQVMSLFEKKVIIPATILLNDKFIFVKMKTRGGRKGRELMTKFIHKKQGKKKGKRGGKEKSKRKM